MLRPAKNIDGCELRARDGKIGHVVDFFFEDRSWTIRYFVVDTGGWLGGRQVLISPVAVRTPDWSQPSVPVDLTVEQIRRAPDRNSAESVSLEDELRLTQHYSWPEYWMMAGAADGGMGMTVPAPVLPLPLAAAAAVEREAQAIRPTTEHHLRSVKALAGHSIEAVDGAVGHVKDFVFDETRWEIRYLVVDTGNWWPGKKVLIAPQWITRLGWEEPKVFVDLSQAAIKGSPSWEGDAPITPEYAARLHDYYGRARHRGW